jgi:hypothetical protein
MFFGREDVFSFVRRNLTGRHRDTPIVLYGQRRTGKTSVLYQMHRHLDPRYRCVFIDLHGLNLNGMENLLWGLATSVSRGLQRDHQLTVPVPDRATFSASPHTAFETPFLDTVWSALGGDQHLLLMIDEVVRLHEEVRAGRLEPEVFDYLRHLMQHFERLNFVFSLGSGVEEMKKDYAFLFGVALYHRISFLEPTAARALVTRPAQDCYQVLPDAAEKILQITSGHPYYTQLVCHCLFDRWLRAPKPQMTSADVDAVLAEAIELGSANLTYVWEDSTPGEQAMMAGMAAAVRTGGSPVTADQIREIWRTLEVRLPAGEAASAARNLATREVVMAGDGAYSFAVDLQRLWLDKHRRLDWVKEELADTVRNWGRSAEASQNAARVSEPATDPSIAQAPRAQSTPDNDAQTPSGESPPIGRQRRRRSRWKRILVRTGIGLVLVWVLAIVLGAIFDHSSNTPPSPNTAQSTAAKVSQASSTEANGWAITGGNGSMRYSKGAYDIYTAGNAYAFATPKRANALYHAATASNLSIDVTVRGITGRVQDYEYGISCRSDATNNNAYDFLVSNTGVSIEKWVNGNESVLYGVFPTVNLATTNQLRAVCVAAQGQRAVDLMLWLNGHRVASAIDNTDPLANGTVGLLLVSSNQGTETDGAEFDNFVVRN